MSATIKGAAITLLVDMGDATIVLGRDVLGDVMNGFLAEAADLTCSTIVAAWSWGARSYERLLTEPETGQLVATIDDPGRVFDPSNEASIYAEALRRDRPVRVLVGGWSYSQGPEGPDGPKDRYYELPAWTGKIRSWSHDWSTKRTTLIAYDALEEAGRVPVSTTVAAGTPGSQAAAAAAAAGYRLEVRELYSDIQRSSHRFDTNIREALMDCRLAALGHVWCDREGHLVWADRSFVGDSVVFVGSSILIGCEPTSSILWSLGSDLDRSKCVNAVQVDRLDPENTGLAPFTFRLESSIAAHGLHPFISSEQELDLEPATSAGYQAWANILLNEYHGMGLPEDELVIGDVRAEGLDAMRLACSDYKAPLWLRFPGRFGRKLDLYGLRVTVTPDGWSFDLVTGRTAGQRPNTEAAA